ncbi:hypothetical protein D7V97_17375 [Corallococcus sp. CA053C]|nr:hypothetical protein D7V97_17375 [Corallococcus sp. CA053C]
MPDVDEVVGEKRLAFPLVVADKGAFEADGGQLSDLALRIFRGDGLLQVMVRMDHTLLRQ